MGVKRADNTVCVVDEETKLVEDLLMITRKLEKYKHIRYLNAAMYLVDGYLEELENMDCEE
ncbi:MAG: hypothetical protein IJZ96_09220 [Lachnospiraceae bacterium]|nr:hypothetical protein [Lachnospiraceae bacterium]